MQQYDIVIAGGGIAGLSFASELAGSDFSVAVIERDTLAPVSHEPECRVSALNLLALQRFQQTGVFREPLMQRICAFDRMFVWEKAGVGQIAFDAAELGLSELGIIIENNVLQHMLLDSIQSAENIHYLCPAEIEHIDYQPADDASQVCSRLSLAGGNVVEARLLTGADGINSRVREVARIQRIKHSYQQQGLVCNVTTSESHGNTAWQCFMPSGPLAFLPLYNGDSSIVWSLDDDLAQQYIQLDDDAFRATLAEASEYRLGDIVDVGRRYLFPLSHGHVNDYVRPGLALIGDAAHNIHPLAGQGANLGIADAFVLAEVITTAHKAGRQWAAQHTLKKYQQRREVSNRLMEMSMTGFKNLFGMDNAVVSEIRNAGLSLVDHMPALKYRIIRQALGV